MPALPYNSIGTTAMTGGSLVGGGPYGTAPLPIPMPPSTYAQSVGAAPGLATLTPQVSGAISNLTAGDLSPSTVRMLQDRAAAYGVSSGMPGVTPGSLALNNLLDQMGLTSEGLTQQGIGDYGSFLGSLSGAQTNPATTADVGEWNSVAASAPNPTLAAQQQENLFNQFYQQQYQQNMFGAGGGGNGGEWWQSNPLTALGPGTRQTGPFSYSTPFLGAA